jgi:hypothetical protein
MDEVSRPPSQAEADGHTLCIACGACCNGTWHPFVNLQPGEDEPARRLGMPIIRIEGVPKAQLPCPLHKNGCCSVYDQWRPASCSGYHCRLLDDVTQGNVPLAEALGHVKAVREMTDRIRAELPQLPAGLLGVQFLKRIGGADEPDSEGANVTPATRLDGVALNMYYMKYFRPPKAEKSAPDQGAEELPSR